MHGKLIYQRMIEVVLPVAGPPQWAWPVPLSDGRAILTLLWHGAAGGQQTVILELSAAGEAKPWGPGLGYGSPVIFYANDADELFGLDLTIPGKVYVCRADGTHCYTLNAEVVRETPIAPLSLHQHGTKLFWRTSDGRTMAANVSSGEPEGIAEATYVEPEAEVRTAFTHLTRDGSLWVVDYVAGVRLARYAVASGGS